MSIAEPAEHKHEIIIVRRGHDDDDHGHHGGVWKIAFADFMTAMMCFFLVMWLINAANEETRAALASYFNPVKLIDRNSSRKGLEDLGDGPLAVGMTSDDPKAVEGKAGGDGQGKSGSSGAENAAEASAGEQVSDQNLFADPYAVLAEIAGESGSMQNISARGDGGAQTAGPASGASGGEAYRDPFAPDFWSQEVAADQTAKSSPAGTAMSGGAEEKPEAKADTAPEGEGEAAPSVAALAEAGEEPEKPAPVKAAEAEPMAEAVEPKAEAAEVAETPKPEAADHAPAPETELAAEEIRKELAEAFEPGERLAEGLTVVAGEKGVTISVTDQFDFGMFEIGSAVPRRELVLAMEKIAKAIDAQKGSVTISGHTDGRPFRSADYDNWRLSTARAHSAYYMLVRAGLDERRVTEVAGYADRKLKDASDPFAAGNRRIEILLEAGG